MSRYYKVDVEVGCLTKKDVVIVEEIVNSWLNNSTEAINDKIGTTKQVTASFYSSDITLCGGESEREAHDRLFAELKPRKVTTRWWFDERPPDEEFTSKE